MHVQKTNMLRKQSFSAWFSSLHLAFPWLWCSSSIPPVSVLIGTSMWSKLSFLCKISTNYATRKKKYVELSSRVQRDALGGGEKKKRMFPHMGVSKSPLLPLTRNSEWWFVVLHPPRFKNPVLSRLCDALLFTFCLQYFCYICLFIRDRIGV